MVENYQGKNNGSEGPNRRAGEVWKEGELKADDLRKYITVKKFWEEEYENKSNKRGRRTAEQGRYKGKVNCKRMVRERRFAT